MSFKRDLSLVWEGKITWLVSYDNPNGWLTTFFWRHYCESGFNAKESARDDNYG